MSVGCWIGAKSKSSFKRVFGWERKMESTESTMMRLTLLSVLLIRGCRLLWGFWVERRWVGEKEMSVKYIRYDQNANDEIRKCQFSRKVNEWVSRRMFHTQRDEVSFKTSTVISE